MALCKAWSKSIKPPIAIIFSDIDHNSIGTPEAHITFRNLTDKDIKSFEVQFDCYDAYGKKASDYRSVSSTFKGYTEGSTFPAGAESTYTWTLYSNERTASIKNIKILKAAATDGTTW